MYRLGLAQAYSCVAMDTKLILVNFMTIHYNSECWHSMTMDIRSLVDHTVPTSWRFKTSL